MRQPGLDFPGVGLQILTLGSVYERKTLDYVCPCGHDIIFDCTDAFVVRVGTFNPHPSGKFEICFHWPMMYKATDNLTCGARMGGGWNMRLITIAPAKARESCATQFVMAIPFRMHGLC